MNTLRSCSGILALLLVGSIASAWADEPVSLPRAEGYVGCWYSVGKTGDEYRFKYSGGMATYPQQHAPIAVYDAPSSRTFFVYGGADPERKSILHMIGYFDHTTRTFPRAGRSCLTRRRTTPTTTRR